MQKLSGVQVLSYGATDVETGVTIIDNALLPLGKLTIHIIHTPGHSDDSICIYIGDAVFTGDTLFVGKVGGTDYGAGAREEYHSLQEKLLKLPDETRVFPGHNVGVAPESTIGREKETNPFLLQKNYADFLYLKKTWLEYKEKHGIL